MTKSQFVHVIVRLFGVILAGLAAWSLLGFLSGLMLLSANPATSTALSGPFVFDAVVRITFLIAAGFYLMTNGRMLYLILNHENDND